MPCAVVNVKKAELRKRGIADLLEWASRADAVYIGRAMRFVPGAEAASRWANPFSVERYGRARCLYQAPTSLAHPTATFWSSPEKWWGKNVAVYSTE